VGDCKQREDQAQTEPQALRDGKVEARQLWW
jgi:hypothetical protein